MYDMFMEFLWIYLENLCASLFCVTFYIILEFVRAQICFHVAIKRKKSEIKKIVTSFYLQLHCCFYLKPFKADSKAMYLFTYGANMT